MPKDGTYVVEVKGGEILYGTPYAEVQSQLTNNQSDTPIMDAIFGLMWPAIALVVLIVVVSGTFFIVRQQTVRIIERLGRFNRVARSGLNFKIPFIEKIAGNLDLRVQQISFTAETKTKDNVFVGVQIAVQYLVNGDRAYEAFYKLEAAEKQINAYILDIIRAEVPKLTLDAVFEQKENIALAVKNQLQETMDGFGYELVQALIVNIEPETGVKKAMNEIQTQTRLREAATQKGEADKVLVIKKAEAEAESKALQGKGIADQRKAIVGGLKDAAADLKAAGVAGSEVMSTILLTQYFDTLKGLGENQNSKVIFLPSTPAGVSQFGNEIRTAIEGSK